MTVALTIAAAFCLSIVLSAALGRWAHESTDRAIAEYEAIRRRDNALLALEIAADSDAAATRFERFPRCQNSRDIAAMYRRKAQWARDFAASPSVVMPSFVIPC